MVNIGLDGRLLVSPRSGIGRYIFELCKGLDQMIPDARFFVYSNRVVEMPVESPRWIARVDPLPGAGRLKTSVWLTTMAGRLCGRDNLDIFWGGATFLPWLRPRVRTVITIYDFCHELVPNTMATGGRVAFALLWKRSIRRAQQIVTISHGTADKLPRFTGRTAAGVVYPSVSDLFRPRSDQAVAECLGRYGISQPYILSVGTLEPRKNLATLMRTFVWLKSECPDFRHTLVVVGVKGWKDSEVAELIASGRGEGRIKYLGYVPDADLPSLYTGCDVFIFPSLYEGFGIPVLEARACGARVVASDVAEIREAGDNDTIYVAPDSGGIRSGLLQALDSPKPAGPIDGYPLWIDGAALLAQILLGREPSSVSDRRGFAEGHALDTVRGDSRSGGREAAGRLWSRLGSAPTPLTA
jgi:glycosyltransferase involved in cell wall biosynthesis